MRCSDRNTGLRVRRNDAKGRRVALGGPLLALTLCAAPAHSEPYIPENDAVVLERLPAGAATRRLAPLRRQLQSDPQDLRSALQLAQNYLQIGRERSDPRFVSYAQATLSPWMRQESPPASVLVLEATALQSSHRFDESLALLDRALALDPRNGQAWLTKATVLQVQGDFAGARAACQKLLQTAGHVIALTCIASVDSVTGRLSESYAALKRVLTATTGVAGGVRGWVLGQLAEMAVRLGDFAAAGKHFRDALLLAPEDAYLLGAYADLLLLTGRNREAIELLEGGESQDVLLLRLAIAARRAGAADATHWSRMFEARRRAVRADDNPHLREHARFLLDVLDAHDEALAVAEKNWRVQREPADVRVYLCAARRAKNPKAEDGVLEWVRRTGYEDRALGAACPAEAGPTGSPVGRTSVRQQPVRLNVDPHSGPAG